MTIAVGRFRTLGLGLALVLVLVIGACNAADSDGGDLAAMLRDRQFLSESVEGQMLVSGTQVRLGFSAGEVSAYAGCNHMSGPFRIQGGKLQLTGLGETEIGCDPALSAQDGWLRDLLIASPAIALDEPRLTLASDATRLTLVDREVASPDRPLAGTAWIGDGIGDAFAVTSAQGEFTVTFGSDGQVVVFAPCQRGSGGFSSDATTITFDRLTYDDGTPCTDAVLQTVSMQVLFVLDGSPVSYTIEEANLTLERAGKLLLLRADE